MADKVRRLTFSTPGFFKNLVSKTTQNGQNHDESSRRTLSDPGADYIPSYNQSIQQDLDNLVSEDSGNLSSPEVEQQSGLIANSSFLRLNRAHWKDKSKFNHCHRCAKPFGFAERKYNCRRCGEVFCEKCCQYRKRLNADCQPDPQGNIHRVCYNCSDLHTQALGECKSLTEEFIECRKNKRIIVCEELDRLVTGFADNVRPDQKLKNFADSLLGIKVPEWQKTQKWLESQEVEWCTKCQSKFTIFNVKHHCRVCGSVFCRFCCKNDLLLYYDEHGRSTARLINVVGCPDKEPTTCSYLPVCILCHADLEEYQVQQFHLIINEVDGEEGNIGHVSLILERLRNVERKLETTLPRFQEKVEAYLYEQQYETVAGESKVTDFAKLQGDISDLFSKYTAIIQGLKQIQLTSPTEIRIMKNIVHVKCASYNDQMNLFKKMKSTLNKSLPAQELEQLLEYTNTQAINNTYVTARQLGFEALALAEKYDFDTEIAERLSEIDAVCFRELKKFVLSTGDDWAIHHKILNSLLKDQLAKKKLVSPSQRAVQKQGPEYVRRFLIQRTFTLVYQISTALKAKSSEEKFQQSKEALKVLLNDLNEMVNPNCY